MGQTLTNGIFLPNEGERNCYTGLAGNWRAIDGYIGDYNVHVADAVIHVSQEDRDKWDAVENKADASALTAHTGNTTIHVTAADKQTWDTVTTKANDTDVLHKSGDETKTGKLTVTELNTTKINNLNPGALSLPNLSAGVDISGYITAGNNHNEYTPTVDGWVSVILKSTSGALAVFIYQGDVGNSYFGNTALPNESNFCGMATIPVKAGTVVNIDTKGSNSYVYAAKFYPCMGNV